MNTALGLVEPTDSGILEDLFKKITRDGEKRLMLAVLENATEDFPAAVQARQLVIQHPGEEHPAKGGNVVVAQRGGDRGRVATDDRINHAPEVMPVRARPRNGFFERGADQ